MFELAKPKIKISDLSHRVALCTMHDVVSERGNMLLIRKPVRYIWAQIDAALNLPSFITAAGYAYLESKNAWGTHRVIIRAQSHVEAGAMAWVYEEKRKTSPRWYKVLGFTESDNWTIFITHLVERSEQAVAPAGADESLLVADQSSIAL